jgi:hypothetical protein
VQGGAWRSRRHLGLLPPTSGPLHAPKAQLACAPHKSTREAQLLPSRSCVPPPHLTPAPSTRCCQQGKQLLWWPTRDASPALPAATARPSCCCTGGKRGPPPAGSSAQPHPT